LISTFNGLTEAFQRLQKMNVPSFAIFEIFVKYLIFEIFVKENNRRCHRKRKKSQVNV
jgi:hypothetical protein